jgi:hypothetical protein
MGKVNRSLRLTTAISEGVREVENRRERVMNLAKNWSLCCGVVIKLGDGDTRCGAEQLRHYEGKT